MAAPAGQSASRSTGPAAGSASSGERRSVSAARPPAAASRTAPSIAVGSTDAADPAPANVAPAPSHDSTAVQRPGSSRRVGAVHRTLVGTPSVNARSTARTSRCASGTTTTRSSEGIRVRSACGNPVGTSGAGPSIDRSPGACRVAACSTIERTTPAAAGPATPRTQPGESRATTGTSATRNRPADPTDTSRSPTPTVTAPNSGSPGRRSQSRDDGPVALDRQVAGSGYRSHSSRRRRSTRVRSDSVLAALAARCSASARRCDRRPDHRSPTADTIIVAGPAAAITRNNS